MPDPELDVERLLQSYVQDRDAVAAEALRTHPPRLEPLLAKLRQAHLTQSQGEMDVEKLLTDYVHKRDAVAADTAPLQSAEIRSLIREATPPRKPGAEPEHVRHGWWDSLRRNWLLTALIAPVVVLLVLLLREGNDKGLAPPADSARVVFALGAVRGGTPDTGVAAALSLPLALEIDFARLSVRLVQSNGIVCTGSLADAETLQSGPLKRRFKLTAAGKDSSGESVEFRGTVTVTTEGAADKPTSAGTPARVLGAILEVQPTIGGRPLQRVRLEYPE
jgi:hypothetical protein